jgi:protein-S-isoprenylcysteine O-methyltransferase Ste14
MFHCRRARSSACWLHSWCIHLGIGVAGGTAWVAVTLPAAIAAEHCGVVSEERSLEREFPAFGDYRRRVPRYLSIRTACGGAPASP